MMKLVLTWFIVSHCISTVFTESEQDKMFLSINDSESLKSVFDLMASCSMLSEFGTNDCMLGTNISSNCSLICCNSTCYNSIDVMFTSGKVHVLKEGYTFADLKNVRFTTTQVGIPSTIKCTNSDTNANPGIAFVKVTNLAIEYLNIVGCGMKHVSTSILKDEQFITFFSALYVQNSTNLSVRNVNISNSNGTGLAIIDTNGTVDIFDSVFNNNRASVSSEVTTLFTGGSGVFIEFSECAPGVIGCNSSNYPLANNSVVTVDNCVFEHNRAWYNFSGSLAANLDDRTYIGFGSGGGLSVQFNGHALDVFIYVIVTSSNFSSNEASNGGGLALYGNYNTSHVNVRVSSCVFYNNSASYFGGGGVLVGFVIFNSEEGVLHNTIVIDGCSFQQNHAIVVGGGLSWHGGTELLGTSQTNYFAVTKSSFVGNQAQYGFAIKINKEYFDIIANGTFLNLMVDSCNFTANSANVILTSSAPSGVGVVSASKVNLQFSGHSEFTSNNSTSLLGDEAELGFHNNSLTVFQNNSGFLGGAILLTSGSWITVHYNSTLVFLRNTAAIDGGAIYVQFATLFDYLISYSCFIRYVGRNVNIDVDDWNASFIFIDNKAADNQSNSLFATTLRPCKNTYSRDFLTKSPFCFSSNTKIEESLVATERVSSLRNTLHCLNDPQDQITTDAVSFCNVSTETLYVIPGKVHDLDVCITDELNSQVTNAQFVATCVSSSADTCPDSSCDASESILTKPRVLPAYRTTNGSIQLAGPPGSACQLQLQTISEFQITGMWSVELLNCPPGLVLTNDVCVCSQGNPAIIDCTERTFQAQFNPINWVGYRSDSATDLLYSACPYEYCYENTKSSLLPAVANATVLEEFVCGGSSRKGNLCGSCKNGYSVTLNSPTFACEKCGNEYKYGFVYLILSYILPVSILFFVIMWYDIRMTTGPIGAFIFFSQIVSSEFHYILIYNINAGHPEVLGIFNAILGIYSISNLDFFNHDIFKYCMFPNAGTVDMVAFELLLSLYPVLLIVLYSVIRKYFFILKRPWYWCFRKFGLSSKSVTHGICAFLVLCFAKINLQAFTILIPAEISFLNTGNSYKQLVYLQGDLEYFKGSHILYAVGSIVFIVLGIAVPLMILLVHPLVIQVVKYFHWGDTKPILLLNKCLMIHKLKPVIDSFQGYYKGNLQFFAGLQIFLYRTLFFLFVVVTTPDIDKVMLLLTGYFVVIIFIHNLVMPFKNQRDNAVYSIIYTLLLAIVIIELYTIISRQYLHIIIWLKVILCSLPLCCFISYYTWKLIQFSRRHFSTFQAVESREVGHKLYQVEFCHV